MTTTTDDVNPRLPTWSGDWTQFRAYEQRVSLEVDATKSDEKKLLGPRLAKNLAGKAWEMIEDINREELRKETGAQYLITYLQQQRGRDKVDLLGDAMRDLLMKQDVVRRDGEEFTDYYPRFRIYVKAIEAAFKDISAEKAMPPEFYGWFLLNIGMRLEPSDIAVIKGKAENYGLKEIEGTLKIMWSGGGLAQKDAERKRWKNNGKSFVVQEEPTVTGIYEALEGGEEENEDNEQEKDDQEQYEEIAAAMLEDPDDERLLVAFQNAKKKMNYKEARKVLAKSRVTREFYPMNKGNYQKKKGEDQGFDGDCMRCGKYGHKARNCPQKLEKNKTQSSSGSANYVLACDKGEGVAPAYVTFPGDDHLDGIYAAIRSEVEFKAIVDSGASETIIGVNTLQELYDMHEKLGFDPRQEIKVDRNLRKSFVFGNSEVSEAIGLATITVGLFGKECEIEAHVVEGSAPLLLSSRFLYQHDVTIDFRKGEACFGDRGDEVLSLERAPSYHLMMSVLAFPGRQLDDGTTSGTRTTDGGNEAVDGHEGQRFE